MLARARKLQHAIVGRFPYSRARGCKALAQGRGEQWLMNAETMGANLDASVALLLLLSAAFALAALAWMSTWLGALGALFMAMALFSMSATMWIDKQVNAVRDHAYLFRN